jgi:hypothetical protein
MIKQDHDAPALCTSFAIDTLSTNSDLSVAALPPLGQAAYDQCLIFIPDGPATLKKNCLSFALQNFPPPEQQVPAVAVLDSCPDDQNAETCIRTGLQRILSAEDASIFSNECLSAVSATTASAAAAAKCAFLALQRRLDASELATMVQEGLDKVSATATPLLPTGCLSQLLSTTPNPASAASCILSYATNGLTTPR